MMCEKPIQVWRPSPISFIQISCRSCWVCDEAKFAWSRQKWTIKWKTTRKIDKIFFPLTYDVCDDFPRKRKIFHSFENIFHKRKMRLTNVSRLYQQIWSSFFIIISAWWKSIKKIDLTNGKLPRSLQTENKMRKNFLYNFNSILRLTCRKCKKWKWASAAFCTVIQVIRGASRDVFSVSVAADQRILTVPSLELSNFLMANKISSMI